MALADGENVHAGGGVVADGGFLARGVGAAGAGIV